MTRVPELPRHELTAFEPLLARIERHLGVLPNSTLTMAHRPEIMRRFAELNEAVMGPGRVDRGLKQLVALVASTAAGCRYCQSHTSQVAHDRGVAVEKIEAVWEFETSPLFAAGERAALRMARDAAQVPNAVTDAQIEDLLEHFDIDQVVELVAVVAVFGYLNRWNDTMATTLESSPLAFAESHLSSRGWTVGRHT